MTKRSWRGIVRNVSRWDAAALERVKGWEVLMRPMVLWGWNRREPSWVCVCAGSVSVGGGGVVSFVVVLSSESDMMMMMVMVGGYNIYLPV